MLFQDATRFAAEITRFAGRRSAGSRQARGELGRHGQGLEDDAVTLGQLQQGLEFFLAGIGLELEAEADRAEADRGFAGDCQGAAEIKVALGVDSSRLDRDP
jgi:hypothetical protein